jgi:hypothetical protein
MNHAEFEEALVLLQQETLLSPLTPSQREYLGLFKERIKAGEPTLDMMTRDAYVVEVLCDAAAIFASPAAEDRLKEALATRYQASNSKRRELFERCVVTLLR